MKRKMIKRSEVELWKRILEVPTGSLVKATPEFEKIYPFMYFPQISRGNEIFIPTKMFVGEVIRILPDYKMYEIRWIAEKGTGFHKDYLWPESCTVIIRWGNLWIKD